MMKIYVDARCLQDENYAFRGVGYHASTLLKAGRELLVGPVTMIGLTDPALPAIPDSLAQLFSEITAWQSATLPDLGSAFIQLSPMTHDQAVCSRFLDRPRILTATIVYDFIPLDVPGRYLHNSTSLHAYAQSMLWLDSYDLFFPISEYSQRRLLETIPCSAASSHVTGVMLREDFEQAYLPIRSHSQSQSKCGLQVELPTQAPYYMFVGGADPRKNVEVVLAAHAQLKQPTQLVIVGHYPRSHQSQIIDSYEDFGGDRSNLNFRHGLSDRQLVSWYRGAVATVCSSRIEGFSLPVIEAIACGSPTIVSDIDAHRELVGNAEHRFAPEDAARLAALLEVAFKDESFRNALHDEQEAVPARFLPHAVGTKFWKPIAQALQKLRSSRSSGGFGRFSRESKPSLAILAPFPPDRSGVADYTLKSTEALSQYIDIDVFTDADKPVATASVRQFYPISDWAYASGGYDRVLSVIGNSHFHTKIIELQGKHGGPCLIHDNRLAELYYWWRGPEYFRQMACRSLRREVSMVEAQGWIGEPGTLPGIFFDELIESANPLLVHSRGIQRQVEKQYSKRAEYLPFCCYRDFGEEELRPEAKRAARAALGMPQDAIVVITLGMVASTKGPQQCIDTVANARKSGQPLEFYFVGPSEGMRQQLELYAKSLHVSSAIHFTSDWVNDRDYRQFIRAADFAIQLRNHFFGGLSGAMLDCIASGLPTIANEDLAEAMDSPNYVLRIGDEMLSDELSETLLGGIEAQIHRDRLLPSRRTYLIDHSFQAYAVALLRVLGLGESAHVVNRAA